MPLRKKLLISLLFLSLIFLISGMKIPYPESGYYSPMCIGINNEKGELTGFFDERTGWDESIQAPKFTCAFYIFGEEIDNNKYEIRTWYPGMESNDAYIDGEITFIKRENQLQIHMILEEEPGGCWNAYPLDTEKGNLFGITESGQWSEIRVVSSDKAYFHKKPSPETKQKSYVIKYDILGIYDKQERWVLAEFKGKKITRAWIRESDLFDLYPEKMK